MHKNTNLVGKTFGNLEVLEEVRVPYEIPEERRRTIWKLKCRCKCGEIFFPFKTNVSRGKTTGCQRCNNTKDLLGSKHGSLQILRRLSDLTRKFLCKCDCGWEGPIGSWFLRNAKDKRCPKCRFHKKYNPKPKISLQESRKKLSDIQTLKHEESKLKKIGKKVGRLKVISFSHWENGSKRRRAYYKCKCKCGNTVTIRTDMKVRSCGCLQKDSAPKGEDHVKARLSNKEAESIRLFAKSNVGYTGRQIAKMFGVGEHLISGILLGKIYKI